MRLPGMPNSEVSKILGDKWRRLPDEEKAVYRSESEKIRRKHKQEHPDYRYHPKRPSRKNKIVDADSPLGASLIENSKLTRPLTPVMNQCIMPLKDEHRPHSAPPRYQHDPLMSLANNPGVASLSAQNNHVSAVSQWWSPSSTPPTCTQGQAPSMNQSHMTNQFQTSLPASPSSQDMGSALSASSSSVWLKQNSPTDSNTTKQRASPVSMAHPSRRHSQSPLVGAASSAARLGNTAFSSTIPMTTMPTSGSLLPTMSGAFYDKTPGSYVAQDQPISTMSVRPNTDLQYCTGLTVSTPRATKNEPLPSSTYDSTVGTDQQRDSVIAPGTVFYPAYQPATAYLPQAAAYGWLDNRTHFVLPEQIANTQHSQIYQQSVAS